MLFLQYLTSVVYLDIDSPSYYLSFMFGLGRLGLEEILEKKIRLPVFF